MNEDKNNVIDFEKEKSPFIHQRKEEKVKKIQEAFKNALPLKKTKKTSVKSRKKGKRKH